MGLELAKAFVTVRGDTGQMASDFNKAKPSVTSAVSSIASSIAGILGTIGVGLGLRSLLGTASESIQLAERQIASEQRLAAVVKATGSAAGFTAKQLGEQASALQAATTVGDEEIMELQSIMLTFKNVQGDIFQRAQEGALDLAAVLGTDAKSAALQFGKALNDPIKGATSLTRAGVQFTQQQKDQIKTLVESNQLSAAQAIILTEVEGQVGGVARAMSQTDAGKLQQSRNILGDMREELGKRLLPTMNLFVQAQIGIQKALNLVAEAFMEVLPTATDVGDFMTDFFDKQLPDMIETLAFTFRNFGDIAEIALIGVVQSGLELFPMLEEPIAQAAALFIGLWDGVGAFFKSIIGNIIGGFKEMMNFGIAVGAAISAAFDSISTGNFSGAAQAATDAFIKTLSAQENVDAPNAFVEFGKAFQEGRNKVLEKLQKSGGLGGFLEERKSGLGGSIAQRESERLQRQEQLRKDAAAKDSADQAALSATAGAGVGTATTSFGSVAFAGLGKQIQDILLKDDTNERLVKNSDEQTAAQKTLVEQGKNPKQGALGLT